MALPEIGLQATIAGMGEFQKNSNIIGKAFESIGSKADGAANIAGAAFSRVGSGLFKLGSIAADAAVSGIFAAGNAAINAAQSGLELNSSMEKVTAQLNALTKDGGESAKILDMIRERAAKTPFLFDEMAQAAAGLLPAAKQSGKGLEELIQTAEILAASNPAEGLKGAAFSLKEALSGDFVSIVERFNLPRKFINQLKKEGVPELEIVSRAMKEMGFDTDLVSNLAETAEGRWSTFQDTMQNLAATVTKPIFDTWSEGLGVANRLFEENAPLLDGLAKSLATVVGDAVSGVVGKVTELIDVFGDKGLAGVFAKLGFKGSALFLKKLGVLFGGLGQDAGALGDTIREKLGVAIQWLSDNLFPMLSRGVQFVTDFITTVTGLFSTFQAGGLFGSRSGSFGSEGLLSALGIPPDIIETIQTVFDSIAEKVNAFMTGGLFGTMKATPGGMQETGGLLRALGINEDFPALLENWAGQVIAAIPGILTQITSTVATFLTDNWPTISAALMEWTTRFWDWTKTAAAGAGTAMMAIALTLAAWAFSPEAQTATSTLGQSIGTMITDAIRMSFEGGEGIGMSMASLMTGLGSVLASLTGSLIILGGQIVAGILSGILESFGISLQPTTFSKLKEILTGIGDNIKTIAKVVGTKIVTSIRDGWNSTVATITTAFQTGVDSWMTIITETKWAELGEGMISGVLKGINDNVNKVYEKLKGMAFEALAQAGAAIGWNSPAAEFIPLGASIPEGIAAGIGQGAGSVTQAMGAITQGMLDSLLGVSRGMASVNNAIGMARDTVEKFLETTIDDNKAKRALTIMGQVFRDNSDIILTATDRAAKFRELLSKINFGVNNQQQDAIMGNGVKIWIEQFDKNLAKLKAAQRDIFIEAGKTALSIGNRLNDIVEFNVGVLDDRVKTLQEFVTSGAESMQFGGETLNQWLAQIRLNEALEEQRAIQDDILQLKQNEQKLSFLEKQLSLVETLNDAGLNVQDILGGISLGLNASIPDMIEATNRLVQAMIDQVNADLQLGSPSKVMMKKGLFAGQGFVEGIMSQIPNAMNAMKQMVGGPSLVNGPALGGSSSQRVNNTYFNMSVNTGAAPQAVIQQFEIARAMIG